MEQLIKDIKDIMIGFQSIIVFMEIFNTICVWEWDRAPQALKDLSTHGGDEDGVAVIPPSYSEIPYCISKLWSSGYIDPQIITASDGTRIVIWAHS